MQNSRFMFLILCLMIGACAPKVTTKIQKPTGGNLTADWAPFALIEDDSSAIDGLVIGEVVIKDGGFALTCDYKTVVSLAMNEAKKAGANCLKITEHKLPDLWSTCHRIKGIMYQIKDAKKYEKEIIWNKNRKLEINDFKGQVENRPFQAVTNSGITYNIFSKPGFNKKKYTIAVSAKFDCEGSYFKPRKRDSLVLVHEQVHFDISELYARKFLKKMIERAPEIKIALAVHEEIYRSVYNELQIKQDEYDSEVYADPQATTKWVKWVEKELEQMVIYENKTVEVK